MSRWSKRLHEESKRLAGYTRALEGDSRSNGEAISRPVLLKLTLAQLGRTRRLLWACEHLGVGGAHSPSAARSVGDAELVCRRVWATATMQREWNEQLGVLARQLSFDGIGTDSWATWAAVSELEDAADEMDEFVRMGADPQGVLSAVLMSDAVVHPITDKLSSLPVRARNEIAAGLQNYRLANLTIRALADTAERALNTWVQVHTMTSMTDTSAAIRDVVRALGGERDDDPELRRFVTAVLETISDVGLDGLKEVTSADLQAGGAGAVGGQPINVLPTAGEQFVCAPFVLAIVSGMKGYWGFGSVIRQLTEHLISCFGTSKRVLVVTDVWDGPSFTRDHLGNWRAFTDRGVTFAVVQYTGTSLQPTVLPVDLR